MFEVGSTGVVTEGPVDVEWSDFHDELIDLIESFDIDEKLSTDGPVLADRMIGGLFS